MKEGQDMTNKNGSLILAPICSLTWARKTWLTWRRIGFAQGRKTARRASEGIPRWRVGLWLIVSGRWANCCSWLAWKNTVVFS